MQPIEPALVHVVDRDPDAAQLLTRWLGTAGIDSRAYAHLATFLQADRGERPGCLVIDAQPAAISGCEPQAILLPLAIRCPIVITVQRGQSAEARPASAGMIDFVEKPLCEPQVMAAIRAAIELDRKLRRAWCRHAEVRARFAALTPRERQIMAFVTDGKLNKQIGGDLGLSEITVKAHRGSVMRKMGARSLAELVRMADALGEALAASRSERSSATRAGAAAGRRNGYTPGPEIPHYSRAAEPYRAR